MRTMLHWTLIAGATASLLACSSPDEIAAGVHDGKGESAAQTLDRRAAAGFDPVAFVDEESNGEAARDFAYSWPRQVSAIAPLAAMLGKARDEELARQKAEWEESVAEFATGDDGYDCIACVNRSYAKSWAVAADLPRFLVLAAETSTYTGGAHGNSQYDGIVWDRDAKNGEGEALAPATMFTSTGALEDAAHDAYCNALSAARIERLEMDAAPDDPFAECPGLGEFVVLPKSSDGAHFDGLTFLAAPYVAGSYAEGAYEFAIPVTEAIIAAVKPKYREAFVAAQ